MSYLKCQECNSLFYTATSLEGVREKCSACGKGILVEISKEEWDRSEPNQDTEMDSLQE